MCYVINRNLFQKYRYLLYSFFSTFGTLFLINRFHNTPFLVYIFLYAGFCSIYRNHFSKTDSFAAESKWVAFIFTFFIALGNSWPDLLFHHSLKSFSVFIVAFLGTFLGILTLIDALLCYFLEHPAVRNKVVNPSRIPKIFFGSFALLWIVYFIFFLNQYPGSLSCDTPNQLNQALGNSSFENANPFINTLLLTICIKIGHLIDSTVNTGIAVYTFFQFTLAALIFAYTVTTIYRHKFSNLLVLFAQCFFNFVPYNIVYATGMWKDTFFAILFLAALTRMFDIIMCIQSGLSVSRMSYFSLFFLVFLASLSRNSGWSSLLILGILLSIFHFRCKEKAFFQLSTIVIYGVLASIITILLIYPMFGIRKNGGITVGLSVPLQQVARVVAVNGELTEQEKDQINKLIDIDRIPELYEEEKSDHIKFNVNAKYLKQHLKEYTILWIKLGLKNPKIYADAYIHLTKHYWSIDSQIWTWDVRIFENPYGVVRDRKLFPGYDLADLFSRLNKIPKMYILQNSALTLWTTIILTAISHKRKNILGLILLTPILALFAGLLLTSPVALFRYTYGATVCIPLMLCFPFSQNTSQ